LATITTCKKKQKKDPLRLRPQHEDERQERCLKSRNDADAVGHELIASFVEVCTNGAV
jgi:hypothetical protein